MRKNKSKKLASETVENSETVHGEHAALCFRHMLLQRQHYSPVGLNIFIYAFPPFSIIWRMLQRIQEECKKAIVIVSLWTTQSWFTRIMELATSQPIIIPSRYLKLPGTKAKHPLYPKP